MQMKVDSCKPAESKISNLTFINLSMLGVLAVVFVAA